ncbi:alkyl sulfatase C-terminal domain-containing protein [Pseudomonas sp. URMO17WK12:I11]|uniref:alkyl sulfatase C-terminal domain-containing protein n=1 Tax=Pseudomonas sp. NFX224 TaxID=3402862 RepID=UPI000720E2B3|nr:hypothetical protein PSHI_27770 [Pseudomonas sp. URMO17WK12:I11]
MLNYGEPLATADATPTLSKATLTAIQMKKISLDEAIAKNDLKIDGNRQKLDEFLGLLDTFPFWFNIVTP